MRNPAILAAFLLSSTAAHAGPLDQSGLDRLASRIGYRHAIVDNRPTCPQGLENCFLSTITLTMPDTLPDDLSQRGLSLYFSFVNRLPRVESDIFDHELVNGDLQRLTLKKGVRLKPGATYEIRLWGIGNHFSKAFVMPNAYLVAQGVEARTIAATRARIDPDTGLEQLPFVAPMTDEARLATGSAEDRTRWLTPERAYSRYAEQAAPVATGIAILPRPSKATQSNGPRIDLTRGVAIRMSGIERASLEPALAALTKAGVAQTGALPLTISVDPGSGIAAEGYRLDATRTGIAIVASDADGARHALRSLVQQAAFDKGMLRPIRIEDAPEYGFRGLHIDLGRNFHSRDEVMKLVEAMAVYKLNRLHLYLADDEGWRIEIPALPELTEIGSKRCHDPEERRCLLPQLGAGPDGDTPVNGYLSEADYLTILRAAAARGIEVIPSIDMPGHSRAAIVSMEARHARLSATGQRAEADRLRLVDPADTTEYRSIQNYDDNTLNVCLPATYAFIDTVVGSIAAMHQRAGTPLRTFHLGADETAGAWVNSPACKTMIAENGGDATKLTPRFIERVAQGLAAKGIRVGGWSDGMGHTDPARMPKGVQTNIWGTLPKNAVAEAHDQLNRGWDVVLSIPDLGYFDMPYVPHPEEGGYDWASRSVDVHQVFGFMPDNLPANAASITDILSRPKPVADEPRRDPARRIAGIQAQLWSETIRTDVKVDYQFFPRLLALAERAWSPAPWTPDYVPGATYQWQDPRIDRNALDTGWRDFAGRLAAQLPLLDASGITYRIAPPGAKIEQGRLLANGALPGTIIEYRASSGPWTRWTRPVPVTGTVELRSRSTTATRTSRVVSVTAD